MIIRYPTGLYSNILPQGSQSGNVTYVISNNPPPRTNLVFPKIPPGIVDRQREPRNLDVLQRRDGVGELAFTISQSMRDVGGSNNKVFETGQILEFSDAPVKSLKPMLVSQKTETQHNANRINYEPLGVDVEDQQFISDASLVAHLDLSDQLNLIRQQRKNAEQIVVENQKIINDSNRTINALKIIKDQSSATDGDVDELILKLEQKKNDAFLVRDQATEAANALAAEAARIQDRLRVVSTVLT
jgi:hypothetical protein